ncbi:hypothetical protein [Salirhabdus sp. Marseille-P4669]|uniref:hypothetical protein n=1 Tax=Salirhabdus sp. Marseille-P4669 TaxID=2042310 RepID=UPI000C7DF8BC|nr:hypothetical protein [Salirhabdus sp. Marseille-P4669]
MSEWNARHERMEVLLDELRGKIVAIEENLEEKAENNDVIVVLDNMIRDKQLVTKTDIESVKEKMEASIQANQVLLMKWIIATGISTIAAISTIVGIFIV